MAKKKSESAASSEASSTKKAAKKESTPKASKKEAKKSGATSSPMIDTNLAANAAAAMVASGRTGGTTASGQPRKESGMFKQLKAGLNKPAAGALGNAFGVTGQSKKSTLPQLGGKQVGHNQTFGADVTRTGVPRRTPG